MGFKDDYEYYDDDDYNDEDDEDILTSGHILAFMRLRTQFKEFLKRKKRRLSQDEAPQEAPPRRRKSSRVERANALLATGGWER